MGNEQSQLSSGPDLSNSYGFQVLRNISPTLNLEPFFDFIVGINGRPIEDPNPNLFLQEVYNCAGSILRLGVWSGKGGRLRDIVVDLTQPGQDGFGLMPDGGIRLGISVQWTPLSVAGNVWRILRVQENSPADLAGLIEEEDFIVGTPEGVVHGENGMAALIQDVSIKYHRAQPILFSLSASNQANSLRNDPSASTSTTTPPTRSASSQSPPIAIGVVKVS